MSAFFCSWIFYWDHRWLKEIKTVLVNRNFDWVSDEFSLFNFFTLELTLFLLCHSFQKNIFIIRATTKAPAPIVTKKDEAITTGYDYPKPSVTLPTPSRAPPPPPPTPKPTYLPPVQTTTKFTCSAATSSDPRCTTTARPTTTTRAPTTTK